MRAIIWAATFVAIIVLIGMAINGIATSNFRRPYMLEKIALETMCPFISTSDRDYQACRFYSATGFIYDGSMSSKSNQPQQGIPPPTARFDDVAPSCASGSFTVDGTDKCCPYNSPVFHNGRCFSREEVERHATWDDGTPTPRSLFNEVPK